MPPRTACRLATASTWPVLDNDGVTIRNMANPWARYVSTMQGGWEGGSGGGGIHLLCIPHVQVACDPSTNMT
jgi:hypothetical protein